MAPSESIDTTGRDGAVSVRSLFSRLGAERAGEGVSASDVVMDVVAFAVTLVFASLHRWAAHDIIWALWISSLCVGYAHIVTGIVTGTINWFSGSKAVQVVGAVFTLGFFSVHFVGFHYGHSAFLHMFFPLVGEGPTPDFPQTVAVTLRLFWPFVLMSFVARWRDLPLNGVDLGKKGTFSGPYANVIRMHILIFVFAGLAMADLSRLAVYPVLAFYFFPWGAFRDAVRNRRKG
jgi:hypothetical protein